MALMKKKIKKEEWVPGHRWSHGKSGWHPGYWRDKRPLGRRNIVSKTPVKLYVVKDQYGHFKGYKTKKSK